MTPASRRIAWVAGAVALGTILALGASVLSRSRADQSAAKPGQPAADMKDMPEMAGYERHADVRVGDGADSRRRRSGSSVSRSARRAAASDR
jgi:hypothetical protein